MIHKSEDKKPNNTALGNNTKSSTTILIGRIYRHPHPSLANTHTPKYTHTAADVQEYLGGSLSNVLGGVLLSLLPFSHSLLQFIFRNS